MWSRKAPKQRKRVLVRLAELILEHRDELALLETLDMGKPIRDSRPVDVPLAAECIAIGANENAASRRPARPGDSRLIL